MTEREVLMTALAQDATGDVAGSRCRVTEQTIVRSQFMLEKIREDGVVSVSALKAAIRNELEPTA
jgi:hypothetical protein